MLRAINQSVSRFLNLVLIAIFVILVLDVLWGVGSRYVLGNQARWSEELARLLMVWLALLGAALAVRDGQRDFARMLLDAGADADARQWIDRGPSAATAALDARDKSLARMLVQAGASLPGEDGRLPPPSPLANAGFCDGLNQ